MSPFQRLRQGVYELWNFVRSNLPQLQDTHQYRVDRHYYYHHHAGVDQQDGLLLFEQSLDVYHPIEATTKTFDDDDDDHNNNNNKKKPIVILVVGSGWAGHRSIIYTGTSWWNASAPKLLARLGCTCICVRHRGGFPQVPRNIWMFSFILVLWLALLLNNNSSNKNNNNILRYDETIVSASVWITVGFTVMYVCLWWLSRGAAKMPDMLQDVQTALAWIHKHIILHQHQSNNPPDVAVDSDDNNDDDDDQSQSQQRQRRRLVWFGGYSSGGHVAATFLQQRPPGMATTVTMTTTTPPIEEWVDQIIFVSGVLGVRPVPQTASSSTPRWLTDLVTYSIFQEQAATLPNPVEDLLSLCPTNPKNNYPWSLPHLFLACQQECFGLNWLDTFFCSKTYHELLLQHKHQCKQHKQQQQQQQQPIGASKYIPIQQTNHWTILSSRGLEQALRMELLLLLNQKSSTQNQQQ